MCPSAQAAGGVTFNSMKADAVLNLRVPEPVKNAMTRAAHDNMRTMSSMAVWAMAEWLSEHGYLDRQDLARSQAARKGSRKGESIESASKSTGEGSTGFGRRDLPPP